MSVLTMQHTIPRDDTADSLSCSSMQFLQPNINDNQYLLELLTINSNCTEILGCCELHTALRCVNPSAAMVKQY